MRAPDGPEKEECGIDTGETGAAQRVLILVLLLLVVLFGYLYFFTGMIKARNEEGKAPAAPAPMAKKPIPPRAGSEDATKVSAPVAPLSPSKPAPAPAPEPAKKAAVEPAKAAGPIKQEVPKPPAVSQAKNEPAKPAPAAPATAKKSPPAPAPVVKGKPAPPAEKVAKKDTPAATAQGKGAAPVKKQPARFALAAGDYILDLDLKKAENKLKKAGVPKLAVTAHKKSETMHRLHVADFVKRAEADTEMKRVQKLAEAPFVLPMKDKYSLFAGSYFREQQATKEKERLSGKGISVTIDKADVVIPVKRLTAGGFATKEEAEKQAGKLAKAGMKVTVVPLAK